MSEVLNPTVPAGWYPDPWGSGSQRWWDGTGWTENLYPQPESPPEGMESAPDQPEPGVDTYEPVAVRSTFEPVPESPLPSRRALRGASIDTEAAAGTVEDAPAAGQTTQSAFAPAESLPAFTQAPEFSPEPVSALPPPVWSEPAEAAVTPEPVAPVEPAAPVASAEPALSVDVAGPAHPAPTGEPVLPASTAHSVTFEPASTSAPTTPAEATADDGWAASLSRWDDVETTSAPPDSVPIFGDAPPVSYSQRAMRYQPLHGRTSAIWLMVFIPLLQAASVVGSMFLFPRLFQFDAQFGVVVPGTDPMSTLRELQDWLLFAAVPLTLAFFVFTLVLGFQDRARLRLLGHDQTASPWWILLSPLVYLIVRSVRVRQCTGRRGSGPLTTYACLYIAPPLAIIVAQSVITALYGAIPA